jgi:DNA repair protein RecN (Recombination protein N)
VLHQLSIRNFASIDRLQVDWQPGLNVVTGETGAGKSIIVDAVGALLGDRLGPEMVRSGADRALVEGVFVLPAEPAPDLLAVLDEFGLEPEDGALIVSREIAGTGGRGSARVNGRGVPLSVLQELGERLVDVHGQSQHMALLKSREQLDYLDRFAGVLAERGQVAVMVRELRATRDALAKLVDEEREVARLQDMLRHETTEIEQASLQSDEEQQLLAQRSRLQHVERLRQAAMLALQALNGIADDSGERPGATELLGEALAACQDGVRFDSALAGEAESLSGALAQAEDVSRSLRAYVDSVEADPEALERTAERLFLIGDLKRKFGETVDDVLAYAADARRRLADIEQRSQRLGALQAAEQRLLGALGAAAQVLSSRRLSAAQALAGAVERQLQDLRLEAARFCVQVNQNAEPDLTGIDHVDFLVAANPGDEPRPMARVASGGELARIALALRTILSEAETRPTLIFDEIDMGVGGRTAPVVGEKLWRVAAGEHQVLCVTHTPQVAAFADRHFVVTKSADDGRAETHIAIVEDDARVDELAAMLSGTASEAARKSALELLESASQTKKKR